MLTVVEYFEILVVRTITKMDHFNITQECIHCFRGSRVFRVDLTLYDAKGKLRIVPQNMNPFRFRCQFCWKVSSLDFYRFSHPDMICYLKRLHDQYEKTRKELDKLYILFYNKI